ncbi:MAG: hypothetical protein KJZ54_08230 [Phycisphaerales bacterium]|nr:hypothetical protein [Phycisphaerales bacterium]
MALLRTERVRWTLVRRCRRCGHDGPELQGDRSGAVFECPACGEDLYARPAMSYAEMEGLAPGRAPVEPGRQSVGRRALRRVIVAIRGLFRRG